MWQLEIELNAIPQTSGRAVVTLLPHFFFSWRIKPQMINSHLSGLQGMTWYFKVRFWMLHHLCWLKVWIHWSFFFWIVTKSQVDNMIHYIYYVGASSKCSKQGGLCKYIFVSFLHSCTVSSWVGTSWSLLWRSLQWMLYHSCACTVNSSKSITVWSVLVKRNPLFGGVWFSTGGEPL